jgi:hypothetical protein
MSEAVHTSFIRLPISLPCNVPVDPATGNAELPMSLRPEKCATDAFWCIGAVPTCDDHMRVVCRLMDIDYGDLCCDMGFEPESPDATPFAERHRYPQAECRNLGERVSRGR